MAHCAQMAAVSVLASAASRRQRLTGTYPGKRVQLVGAAYFPNAHMQRAIAHAVARGVGVGRGGQACRKGDGQEAQAGAESLQVPAGVVCMQRS